MIIILIFVIYSVQLKMAITKDILIWCTFEVSLCYSLFWYKKVFFFLLDIAVVNAFTMQKAFGHVMTLLAFQTDGTQAIAGEYPTWEGVSNWGLFVYLASLTKECHFQGNSTYQQKKIDCQSWFKVCYEYWLRKITQNICQCVGWIFVFFSLNKMF